MVRSFGCLTTCLILDPPPRPLRHSLAYSPVLFLSTALNIVLSYIIYSLIGLSSTITPSVQVLGRQRFLSEFCSSLCPRDQAMPVTWEAPGCSLNACTSVKPRESNTEHYETSDPSARCPSKHFLLLLDLYFQRHGFSLIVRWKKSWLTQYSYDGCFCTFNCTD